MRVYLLLALCGLSFAHTNYIFGGDEVTEEGKWPWQVQSLHKVLEQDCGKGPSINFMLYNCMVNSMKTGTIQGIS